MIIQINNLQVGQWFSASRLSDHSDKIKNFIAIDIDNSMNNLCVITSKNLLTGEVNTTATEKSKYVELLDFPVFIQRKKSNLTFVEYTDLTEIIYKNFSAYKTAKVIKGILYINNDCIQQAINLLQIQNKCNFKLISEL